MSDIDRANLRVRRPQQPVSRRPGYGVADRNPRAVSSVRSSSPAPATLNSDRAVPTAAPASIRQHLKRMSMTAGHSWAFHEHKGLFNGLIKRFPPKLQQQIAAYRRGALGQRLAVGGITAVLILSISIPLLNVYVNRERYHLGAATTQLIGTTNSNLVSKITYDAQSSSYYFNKAGITSNDASPAAALTSQVGGEGKKDKSLYSVQLPTDPTKGITYYDDNLDLSFSLTPQLKLMAAQQEQGRIVYPARDGIQDVFTTKGNGLKDDIILTKPGADSENYSYKLNLPKTLQAKMIGDSGEVGIYSADSTLYNNISFGDSASQSAVQAARENGAKNNLVFVLPAPVIKQYDAKTHTSVPSPASAHFTLSSDGTTLQVSASGLAKAAYPLTIDPSVVTTSSSDFSSGNNEDNIDFSSANQINRSGLSGGSLATSAGSWTTNTNSLTAGPTQFSTSVAYNGYIYELGGQVFPTGAVANTYYAALNPNGSVGTFTPTTALPQAIQESTSVAYNGYIYVLGGYTGTSNISTTYYAPLNSNGTIGTWNTTTALSQTLDDATSAVYNGYIYELGGYNGTSAQLTTYYAPLHADGTIGTWNTTTALSQALYSATTVIYNGYIYELGGYNGTSVISTTYYAPLNSSGTIGTWNTTTALPVALLSATSVTSNGYIYELGGSTSSPSPTSVTTTYYAPLNSNGTIGAWNTTTVLPQALARATSVAYNGYIYELGGLNSGGGGFQTTVYYAKIDPAGATATTTWNSATASTTTNSAGGECTVAYNGYLYYFGGSNGATYWTNTQYAAISANGTIGTWTNAGTAFSATARTKAVCTAYNGFLYVGGGYDGTTYYNDFYQSPIGAAGAPGSWTTDANLPLSGFGMAMTSNNGYLYLAGGTSGLTSGAVYYASVDATTGTPSGWTGTTSLNSVSTYGTLLTNGNYIYYVGGGSTGSGGGYGTIEYDTINSNGTLGGAWTTQAYSPSARTMAGAAIWNGYLYIFGGWDNGSNYYTDTSFAPLNTNGSAGTWTTESSTLSPGRNNFGYASYNGYLYMIGGRRASAPTYGNDTQYIGLNNGGQGTTNSWTTATNSLASSYSGFSGVRDVAITAANGYLYAVGGCPGTNGGGCTVATANVFYSPINTDGSPGTWTSTSAMNYARASESLLVYNGYVYAFGGYQSGGSNTAGVEYALICTGSNSGTGGCSSTAGTLGTWTLGTSFTDTNMKGGVGAAMWNGYFYVMGGHVGSYSAVVDYAVVNSDGSVGTWTATTSMTSARNTTGQVAIYNGYLYVFGGQETGANIYDSDFEYAQINSSTHALGSFTDVTSGLPWAKWNFGQIMVANGYVYLVGGLGVQFGTSGGRSPTFYAALNEDGSLGEWQQTSSLSTTHYAGGGVYYNGTLYQAGGYVSTAGGTYFTDVQYTSVNALPRIAHYSKLFDLSNATNTITSITYNGTLPNGINAISYKTAGSSATFGSLNAAASISTPHCISGGTIRYIWVTITMDDSQSGTFADSVGVNASLTDFTVNYAATSHPAPNVRLRAGQTLATGTLSALDTCYP